jgi:hypothetical protein
MSQHPTNALPMLNGAKYRATHQASVDAVLGAGVRRVESRGGMFYNRDRWTLRVFVTHFCAWVSQNQGRKPTSAEITDMVRKANNEYVGDPGIVIAATPEKLPLHVALALVGGAYHESWHTKYSRRSEIRTYEVEKIVNAVWDRVENWAPLGQTINTWANIVEDIRIERCGCQEYPGAEPKMQDLQSFILDKEEESRNEALVKFGPQAEASLNGAYGIISATFRDVGLGYNTEHQRRALEAYRQRNSEAVDFVLSGPLAELLRETINLSASDDVASLRIAMEVVAAISEKSKEKPEDKKNEPQDGEPQDGESPEPRCPNCGSADLSGKKSGGKVTIKCGHCGYQWEQDAQDSKKGKGKGKGISVESDEEDEGSDDSDDGGEESEKSGKDPKKSKGSKSDEDGEESEEESEDSSEKGSKKSKDDEDSEDEGSGGSGEGGDSEEEGEESGKGSKDSDDEDSDSEEEGEGEESGGGEDSGKGSDEGDESEGEGDESGEDSEGDSEGEGSDNNSESDDAKNGNGAGGFSPNKGPAPGWDIKIAEEILASAEKGEENGLLDNNSAIGEAVDEERAKEDGHCKQNEAVYRPYDRSLDTVALVLPSQRGKADDEVRARDLLATVKSECNFLRSRLRTIIRSVEQTSVEHGVRRGRGLSQRMFVDDKVALMNGRMPHRPDFDIEEQIDTSMAAAVVVDESGSMDDRLQLATQTMMAIVEPLDSLTYPTMALGFRNGAGFARKDPQDRTDYFRYNGSHIDVFKTFDERFSSVKWRFANTQATGGTPMADGVQYGLEALADRNESHRVLFIITDGCPDGHHINVINHQIRVAKELGIHLVGVGIGSGAEYVKTLFPDHVYAKRVSDLPKELLKKLNEILDFRAARGSVRGRQAKKRLAS